MVVPVAAPRPVCRAGGDDDHDYMVELAERTFVDFGDYRMIIEEWLSAPRVQSVVLDDRGERLGFALVAQHRGLGFWRATSAELVAIALEPRARGRRLGSLLLRAAEDEARRWSAHEMKLHTAIQNRVARSFFHAAGYRVREGRATFYPNGQPALELRRRLC